MSVLTNHQNQSRGFVVLSIVLLIVVICLGAYILQNELRVNHRESNGTVIHSKEEILRPFKTLFLSSQEANDYIQTMIHNENETKEDIGENFTVVCPESNPNLDITRNVSRKKRRALLSFINQYTLYFPGYKNHGCCKTKRMLVSPTHARTGPYWSSNVQIYHGGLDDRQYFLYETFTLFPNCNLNCGCQRKLVPFLAVVYSSNPSDFIELKTVYIPGSTKCVNGASNQWSGK